MKRFAACVMFSVFVLAGALLAQEPNNAANKEDVQKLFDLMNSRQQVTAMFDVVKQQVNTMVSQMMEKRLPNATPEERAKMAEHINGMYQKMFDSMPIAEMLDAMIPAYQHHFNPNDVQQLIQFYSSPVGQKLLTQMPSIMSEAMQAQTPLMQKWISEQMPQVQKSVEEFARSLRNQRQKPASLGQKS